MLQGREYSEMNPNEREKIAHQYARGEFDQVHAYRLTKWDPAFEKENRDPVRAVVSAIETFKQKQKEKPRPAIVYSMQIPQKARAVEEKGVTWQVLVLTPQPTIGQKIAKVVFKLFNG
ncbi:hypothetical protein HY994_03850 [Candidatus Micrarchaeota archaeon]|nr:hypothetical protein [Candidatus Micrarchaeota archaeon]